MEVLEAVQKLKKIAQAHPLKSITYLDDHSRLSKNPTKVSIIFENGESFLFNHEDFQKHVTENISFKINIAGKNFEDYKKK